MDPEAALLARSAQGDEAALSELYDRLGTKVYTLALNLLGSREEAEEVSQEVFYKLFNVNTSYHTWERSPRAFIYTLARNAAHSRLRKRQSRPLKADAWDIHDPSVPFASDLASPDVTRLWLERGLATLSAEERHLIEHAYFLGYSYAELAELEQKPLGTIRSKIRRALLKLRGAMESGGHGDHGAS